MKLNSFLIVFVFLIVLSIVDSTRITKCKGYDCFNNSLCWTLKCNDSKGTCDKVNVKVCPNLGNPCMGDACLSETGQCYQYNKTCNDNVDCTENTCDPTIGCVYTANNTKCANNLCSTGECSSTGCVLKTCTAPDKCQKSTGCDAATGKCKFSPITCNDGIPCTTDTCDPLKGCVYSPTDSKCEDNNNCTINQCTAKGCLYTPKVCTPRNKCETSTGCDSASGECQFKPIDCSSSNKCETKVCNTNTGSCELKSTKTCPTKEIINAVNLIGVVCQPQKCDSMSGECINDGPTNLLCLKKTQ